MSLNHWNHLVVPLQPKYEIGKYQPYRKPIMACHPFDAHFKDKGENNPHLTHIIL